MNIVKEDNVNGANIFTATDGRKFQLVVNGQVKQESSNIDAAVAIHQSAIVFAQMGLYN